MGLEEWIDLNDADGMKPYVERHDGRWAVKYHNQVIGFDGRPWIYRTRRGARQALNDIGVSYFWPKGFSIGY